MKHDNTQKVLHQIGATVKRDDLTYSTLCGDSATFSRLCFHVIAAIALFPHCAAEFGFV